MKADWQPTEEVGEAPGSQGMEAVVGEQEDVFSKAQLKVGLVCCGCSGISSTDPVPAMAQHH